MIDYQLIRSKRRKTLALQVKHGQVIVRAPTYVKEALINAFVQKKSLWLKSKVTEQIQATNSRCNFLNGGQIYLYGEKLELKVSFAQSSNVVVFSEPLGQKFLSVELNIRLEQQLKDPEKCASAVKKQLEKFFKQQATEIINRRLSALIEQVSLFPTAINIRQYSARWGSCNSRGELSFNYLLMMVPDWVLDYVIIHELCHLEHLNHSNDFWRLVSSYFPKYSLAKQWLNTHQTELVWRL